MKLSIKSVFHPLVRVSDRQKSLSDVISPSATTYSQIALACSRDPKCKKMSLSLECYLSCAEVPTFNPAVNDFSCMWRLDGSPSAKSCQMSCSSLWFCFFSQRANFISPSFKKPFQKQRIPIKDVLLPPKSPEYNP